MKGHLPIIEMRRQGVRPDMVFIATEPDRQEAWKHWPERSVHLPHVLVERDDSVGRLDLRFLVGLTVSVTGEDYDRVVRLSEACQNAGAQRVITVVFEWRFERGEHVPHITSYADTLTTEGAIDGAPAQG